MATKITDVEVMKKLWKDGVIDKSTYYRGRKRGYIILDYHKPHQKRSEEAFDSQKFWNEVSEVYVNLKKIATGVINVYNGAFEPDELINEGVIYLLERRIYPTEGFAHFKTYIKGLVTGKGKATVGSWRDRGYISYDEQWDEDDEDAYGVAHYGETLFDSGW